MKTTSLPSWQIDAIGAAALIVIALGAYALQIRPAIADREERAARAAELTTARDKAADLESSTAQLKEKLRGVRQSVAQSVQLEPASQLNARLAKLTELAAANTLQVDAIEPGLAVSATTNSAARYETIPIRLAGRGGYRAVTEFLRTLHQTLPDTGVAVLELTADNAAGATFTVQLQWHTAPHGAHDNPALKLAGAPL